MYALYAQDLLEASPLPACTKQTQVAPLATSFDAYDMIVDIYRLASQYVLLRCYNPQSDRPVLSTPHARSPHTSLPVYFFLPSLACSFV